MNGAQIYLFAKLQTGGWIGEWATCLSTDKGSVGRAFSRMDSIMNSPNSAFRDCSQSAAEVAWGGSFIGKMDTGTMDQRLQSDHASPDKAGAADATSGDIVRYADSHNTPEHFASFVYTNDSGTPMVFSVSGQGGPKQVGAASDFEGAQAPGVNYGTIRGVNPGESGYYRPE